MSTVLGKPQSPGHASSCGSHCGCAGSTVTGYDAESRVEHLSIEAGLEHAMVNLSLAKIAKTAGSIPARLRTVKMERV